MNRKFILKPLLFLSLLNMLFISCTLSIQDNKSGSMSFILPGEVNRAVTDVTDIPNFFEITVISKDKKVVYEHEHYAGSTVKIRDLRYGKYTLSIKASTYGANYSSTQEVEIKQSKTPIVISLNKETFYSSIKLSVKLPLDSTNAYYTVTTDNGKIIKDKVNIPITTSLQEILINDLSIGNSYNVSVFADVNNDLHESKTSTSVVLKKDVPTPITLDSFTPCYSTITIKTNPDCSFKFNYKLINTETNEVSYSETSLDIRSLDHVIHNVKPGMYKMILEGHHNTFSYRIDRTNSKDKPVGPSNTGEDIIFVKQGHNLELSLAQKNRQIYYVRSDGDDNNKDGITYGYEDKPFKTVSKAIDSIQKQIAGKIIVLDDITEDITPDLYKVIDVLIVGKDRDIPVKISGTITNSVDTIYRFENIHITNITLIPNNYYTSLGDGVLVDEIHLVSHSRSMVDVVGKIRNTKSNPVKVYAKGKTKGDKIVNTLDPSYLEAFSCQDCVMDENGCYVQDIEVVP